MFNHSFIVLRCPYNTALLSKSYKLKARSKNKKYEAIYTRQSCSF